ncbi:response regulator [bacterium]|nr:response regulator [bacterium]
MNRRILVVDDNPAIHEDFQKILGSAGADGLADLDQLELELLDISDPQEESALYQLDYASGGQQALEMLVQARQEGNPYSMAFVDMRMPPGWDGLETIERLWQEDPQLQVVICTAYSDYSWDELQARVKSAENLFLLSKPFDMMEIRQAAAAMTLKRHLTASATAHIDSLEETLGQSREKLQETNQRLKAILDAAPVGILTADADFQIRGLNRVAQELFGLTSEEAAGRPLQALLSVPHPAEGSYICSGLRVDQSSFPAQLKLSQLALDSGLLNICIVVDQTERQRAEAERRQLESQLFQAQKLESLGILAGGVAHDFNNMLMAIIGYSETALLDAPDSGPLRDMVVNIKATALQAAAVTQQMLSYAGRASCSIEPLSLNEVVRGCAHLLKLSVPAHISWNLELAEALPKAEADPGLLQQIIVNLVMNAAEAIGADQGSITLSTGKQSLDRDFLSTNSMPQAEPGLYAWLACRDSGPGLAGSLLARIFDPFFSTKADGRGLGLSSVLGIVKSHQGTLRVESEVGQGSTFWVYFPISHLPSPDRQPRRSRTPRSGKILVVDDQDSVRGATGGLIKRLGFELVTASHGEEALNVCRDPEQKLVAVLMDVSMPGMGGKQAAEMIHEIRPELPILFMSGYASENLTPESQNFLHKPFTLEALEDKLNSLLTPAP